MKVIDLLQRIANGEPPKKIKYNDTEYYLYDRKSYLRTDRSRFFDSIYFKELNDEVEIIEKDKKIEKIGVGGSIDVFSLKRKINEIIDYINGGTNENTRN